MFRLGWGYVQVRLKLCSGQVEVIFRLGHVGLFDCVKLSIDGGI